MKYKPHGNQKSSNYEVRQYRERNKKLPEWKLSNFKFKKEEKNKGSQNN